MTPVSVAEDLNHVVGMSLSRHVLRIRDFTVFFLFKWVACLFSRLLGENYSPIFKNLGRNEYFQISGVMARVLFLSRHAWIKMFSLDYFSSMRDLLSNDIFYGYQLSYVVIIILFYSCEMVLTTNTESTCYLYLENRVLPFWEVDLEPLEGLDLSLTMRRW